MVAAAAFADEARCMDLADRYVNSECVKRMLQADQVFSIYIFEFHSHSSAVICVVFSFACSDFLLVCSLDIQVALAEKTAVLFTKDGDQHNNLHDMQCMWFVSNHV